MESASATLVCGAVRDGVAGASGRPAGRDGHVANGDVVASLEVERFSVGGGARVVDQVGH